MADNTQSRIENVEGPLVSGAKRAEGIARRVKDEVVDRTQEGLERSRDYIRENPVQTVLIAAGVGALVGYLVSRRR